MSYFTNCVAEIISDPFLPPIVRLLVRDDNLLDAHRTCAAMGMRYKHPVWVGIDGKTVCVTAWSFEPESDDVTRIFCNGGEPYSSKDRVEIDRWIAK